MLAAETDEVYMQTAADTLKDAEWGMFCIPGIARREHIDMGADYEMDFIRIGCNVSEFEQLRPFVTHAKKHGMYVCANLMKSYTVPPAKFAECAAEIEKYGVDALYIVDSSGGMLPNELIEYFKVTRERCPGLPLAFHGHNNLGLGVANTLAAIEHGAAIVDTTLQGFGRSAGNAPTEQLLSALTRMGIDTGIDPIEVMDIGEHYIQPMIERTGISSIDVISGQALFHSSYMPIIRKFASQYHVDPRRLIVAVCEHDTSDAPEHLVESQARRLAEEGVKGEWSTGYKRYVGGEQS
jgi:4-hydroxy-2-oxovalerate aldolase